MDKELSKRIAQEILDNNISDNEQDDYIKFRYMQLEREQTQDTREDIEKEKQERSLATGKRFKALITGNYAGYTRSEVDRLEKIKEDEQKVIIKKKEQNTRIVDAFKNAFK